MCSSLYCLPAVQPTYHVTVGSSQPNHSESDKVTVLISSYFRNTRSNFRILPLYASSLTQSLMPLSIPQLKKGKETRGMPLPGLGPIPLKNVEFRDGMGPRPGNGISPCFFAFYQPAARGRLVLRLLCDFRVCIYIYMYVHPHISCAK